MYNFFLWKDNIETLFATGCSVQITSFCLEEKKKFSVDIPAFKHFWIAYFHKACVVVALFFFLIGFKTSGSCRNSKISCVFWILVCFMKICFHEDLSWTDHGPKTHPRNMQNTGTAFHVVVAVAYWRGLVSFPDLLGWSPPGSRGKTMTTQSAVA